MEGGVPGEASDEEYEDLPASKGGKTQQERKGVEKGEEMVGEGRAHCQAASC
jgi:hypothetical protein